MKEFSVGDRVRVIALPPYVKTAEPMPMLRPPSVIAVGEEGTILEQKLNQSWSIRFTKGAFLLDEQYFELANAAPSSSESPTTD